MSLTKILLEFNSKIHYNNKHKEIDLRREKMILEILEQLRNTTSTKEKFNILLSHKDNKDLEKVLKYTYDKVDFTYGVTPATVLDFDSNEYSDKEMFEVLDILNRREVTGHSALALAKNFYESCDKTIKDLFLKILDRDLKIGVNEKTLNKVFGWKKKD